MCCKRSLRATRFLDTSDGCHSTIEPTQSLQPVLSLVDIPKSLLDASHSLFNCFAIAASLFLFAIDLGSPVFESGFWESTSWTVLVTVPEAAVNEYRQFVAAHCYVRSPRYVRGMYPISHTFGPQVAAYKHFGACVPCYEPQP